MRKVHLQLEIVSVLVCFVLFSTGCASKPRVYGKGEMCGVVIDENNNPVADYIISCRKDLGGWHQTLTNDEGMFFFNEMVYGYYGFKGKKECFVDLEEKNYLFNDCGKVFYFQVNSIDMALDNIDRQISCENYQEALDVLKQIECKRKTPAMSVVNIYRKFLEEKIAFLKAETKRKLKEEKKNEA